MLSFGFDTCIKVNSPLVNRLISDTSVDVKPHTLQSEATSVHQRSVLTDFRSTRYCSTPHIL